MITQQRANQLLSVDFETGELFWFFNYQRPDLHGRRAGYLSEGYWKVSIEGKIYYAAQIVWLLAYGYIPDRTIDHADTNKSNDALSNLRLASKGQNAANSKMSSRNSTGFKGVSLCSSTGRYRASITINGHSKNLGRYDSPEEAHEAWVSAAVAAFGEEFVRAA